MEQREQYDHFFIGSVAIGNTQSVLHHPRPVRHPVKTSHRERVAPEDPINDESHVMQFIPPIARQ
jgi:hypothetical protein